MPVASWDDAFHEFGYNYGSENRDRAWLLHDNDVWVRNPHYVGPPVRHPEDDDYYESEVVSEDKLEFKDFGPTLTDLDDYCPF